MLWGGCGFLNCWLLFFLYEVCFPPEMFPALGTLLLHNSLLGCFILFLCVLDWDTEIDRKFFILFYFFGGCTRKWG